VDNRQSSFGPDRSKLHGSQAAFLEFLAAAARTRIVSPDASDRVLARNVAGIGSFCPQPSALVVLPVLLAKAIPSRELFNGVAEESVLLIVWTPHFLSARDAASQILLEMFEPENVAVDIAPARKPSLPKLSVRSFRASQSRSASRPRRNSGLAAAGS
jgi:hypothetical protein